MHIIMPSVLVILIILVVFGISLIIGEIITVYIDVSMLLFLLFTIVLGLAFLLIPKIYSKNIQTISTVEIKQVQLLPNQVMNTESYSFIVDSEELETEKTNSTKYINDSSTKPYIIVTKIVKEAPYRWYVNKSSTQMLNETIYKLNELHY